MSLIWWILLVVAVVVVALAIWPVLLFPRSTVSRRVAEEGYNDAAVGAGFAALQETKIFKGMRKIVVNQILQANAENDLSLVHDVLDIGCGTGHLIKVIHDELGQRGMHPAMHGVDIGAASIAECLAYLAQSGLNDVDVKEGDAAMLPFPDDSMDLILSSLSLHHWSKPEQVLVDIHRVLRHGGRFILFDLRRDARNIYHYAFYHWFRPTMPEPLRSVGEPHSSLLAAYSIHELSSMINNSPWKDERVDVIPKAFTFFVDVIKK